MRKWKAQRRTTTIGIVSAHCRSDPNQHSEYRHQLTAVHAQLITRARSAADARMPQAAEMTLRGCSCHLESLVMVRYCLMLPTLPSRCCLLECIPPSSSFVASECIMCSRRHSGTSGDDILCILMGSKGSGSRGKQ